MKGRAGVGRLQRPTSPLSPSSLEDLNVPIVVGLFAYLQPRCREAGIPWEVFSTNIRNRQVTSMSPSKAAHAGTDPRGGTFGRHANVKDDFRGSQRIGGRLAQIRGSVSFYRLCTANGRTSSYAAWGRFGHVCRPRATVIDVYHPFDICSTAQTSQ